MLSVPELRQIIKEKIPSSLVIPEHDHLGHHYRFIPTNKVYDSVTTKTSILENPRLKRWAANLAVQYIDRNWKTITPDNKDDHYKAAILAHEDELQDAGDIGTQGHHAIERYLKRWIDTNIKPEDIRKFILGEDARLYAITRSAEMFVKDFEMIPIAAELNVASARYEYAGQLDCLAVLIKEMEQGKEIGQHECVNHYSPANTPQYRAKYWQCGECGRIVKPVFSVVDWKTSNSIDKPEYAMQVAAYYHALWEMTGLRPEELVIVRLDKYKANYEVVRLQDRPAAFRAFKHVGKVSAWINNGVSKLLPYSPKDEIFL